MDHTAISSLCVALLLRKACRVGHPLPQERWPFQVLRFLLQKFLLCDPGRRQKTSSFYFLFCFIHLLHGVRITLLKNNDLLSELQEILETTYHRENWLKREYTRAGMQAPWLGRSSCFLWLSPGTQTQAEAGKCITGSLLGRLHPELYEWITHSYTTRPPESIKCPKVKTNL